MRTNLFDPFWGISWPTGSSAANLRHGLNWAVVERSAELRFVGKEHN